MEPDRRNRISDVYHAALAHAAEERGAFLKVACEGDEILRQEVESLLRYESASSRFLETPAAAVAAAARGQTAMLNRQIGSYTIVAPLGAGGMGEVYRARDSKLARDVAIKILPSHFTADPERRSRFAREARLLATLNHPHIGSIYGLEEAEGVTALVLELIEGPTLADRLERGPLPIADALTIARQIAEALDAAHEKGIVHRDLKPGNIVLQSSANAAGVPSSETRAKVLDFGLAKTMAVGLEGDLTQRPPGSLDGTEEGRVLGTPAYMSPEQARGQAVDKRTDIWAFGCVLYEMLSGQRAFEGATVTDTFARILEHEPDSTRLPVETPTSIRKLIERCLRKDPRKRLHDIADALIELEDGSNPIAERESVGDRAPGVWQRPWLGWIVAATLALGLAGTMLRNGRDARPGTPELVQFSILPPEGSTFTAGSVEFAMSPDGRHIAFVATSKAGASLWVRSLAAADPRPLPGTEGARYPFWSPDSQSIGFFASNQLKTVQVNGRSPVVPVVSGSLPWPGGARGGFIAGGTWNDQGVIVFGPSVEGNLYQISVKTGGTATAVTRPMTTGVHRGPSFLPDGQHFLYMAWVGTTFELRLGSLTNADTTVIGTSESPAAYASGQLFFVRGGTLMAQPFNTDTLKPQGDPVSLGVPIRDDMPGVPTFSVSATGGLVFLPPPGKGSALTWLDRRGRPMGTVGDPGVFGNLDLSPDGQRLAITKVTPGRADIWLMDVATGRAAPLTDDPRGDFDATWSPDGKHIVFNSNRQGRTALFMRASDGSGVDVPLVRSETYHYTVAAWSRADVLIFNVVSADKDALSDLGTRSVSGEGTPNIFLNSKFNELNGTFSPDGRWVAYQTDASGRYEVVVRPFPTKHPARPVSRDGGMYPRWRGDGREVFFLSADGAMMATGFDPTTGVPAAMPQRLFQTQVGTGDNRPYAVDKKGERFLLPIAPDPTMIAVMNWRALLDR